MNSKEQNSNNFGKQSEKIPQNRQAQTTGVNKEQKIGHKSSEQQNQRNSNLDQKGKTP